MKSGFKFAAVLAAMALLVTGCGHDKGGVALIDLTAIAQATGQDEVIRLKAEANREELMARLQDTAMNLDQQIAAEREKFGETPTPEQEQQIQMMTMQARQQLGEMQNQAQQQVNQVEQELVDEFRDSVAPMAAEIAQSRGASMVLAKDVYVFWYEAEMDITDAVIAAWRARDTAVPEPEAAAETSSDTSTEGFDPETGDVEIDMNIEMSPEERAEADAMIDEVDRLLREEAAEAEAEAAPAAE